MSEVGTAVSSDDVVAAYRMFLGRLPAEPEIAVWLGTKSVADLRRAFLSSDEFATAQKSASQARLTGNLPAADIEWQTDAATAARLLEHTKRTWTALGNERPHWSVLSSDLFLPEQIATNENRFFASGAGDLAALQSALERHGSPDEPSVFEYGCGVGRVTAHLAGAFKKVTACDISSSHLELARQTVANRDNVTFRLVEDADFAMPSEFGIWISYIVLQHNPPPIIAMILSRMFKMLAPGGLAIFQVPTYCLGYRFSVADYLDAGVNSETIEVHCLPQSVIFSLAHEAKCMALEVREDGAMGPPSHWLSNTFIFRKLPSVRGWRLGTRSGAYRP
jgi:SAM-dependent methyltransferase